MYTPEQTAMMLRIGKSTLRKYAALFSNHLSDSANKSSKLQRTYSDADIAMLKNIIDLRAQNVPIRDIDKRLGVVVESSADESLQMIPAVNQRFEELYATLASVAKRAQEQEEVINQLRSRIEQLENKPNLLGRLFRRKPEQRS